MLLRLLRHKWPSIRLLSMCGYSTTVKSFFQLFPNTFPHGGPPKEPFMVNLRALRREYRHLQSEHHPDIVIGSQALKTDPSSTAGTDVFSSLLNRGYSTIRNPYTRVAHLIELHQPQHVDVTKDEVAKEIIAGFQQLSPEKAKIYGDMLMQVLDAHEALEMAENESDLDDLSSENDIRIEETEKNIDRLLREKEVVWEAVMMEAIRMKYWVNIQNGIKEWEQGKPVHLTH